VGERVVVVWIMHATLVRCSVLVGPDGEPNCCAAQLTLAGWLPFRPSSLHCSALRPLLPHPTPSPCRWRRPDSSLGQSDEYVADLGGQDVPFVVYFSPKKLRRPPPEYVEWLPGDKPPTKKQKQDAESDNDDDDDADGELTHAEVAANVPTALAVLSLRFVGRLKFAFVPRSETAIISTFKVTRFPSLLSCKVEPAATTDEGDGGERSGSGKGRTGGVGVGAGGAGAGGATRGEDDQAQMTISTYSGALTYTGIAKFARAVASTSASYDDNNEKGFATTMIQQASDLGRQCGACGTCIKLVALGIIGWNGH
jgi:hypothetical protein